MGEAPMSGRDSRGPIRGSGNWVEERYSTRTTERKPYAKSRVARVAKRRVVSRVTRRDYGARVIPLTLGGTRRDRCARVNILQIGRYQIGRASCRERV